MKRPNSSRSQGGPHGAIIEPTASRPGGVGFGDAAWMQLARSLRLSKREVEISRGVFENLKEQALAAELNISEHTIHTHLNRLFRKLHVQTRAQMVLRIMQEFFALTRGGSLPSICHYRATGRCKRAL